MIEIIQVIAYLVFFAVFIRPIIIGVNTTDADKIKAEEDERVRNEYVSQFAWRE